MRELCGCDSGCCDVATLPDSIACRRGREQTSAKLLTAREQNSSREQARRRPLVQYVVLRVQPPQCGEYFEVHRSAAGSKPSHWMVERPVYVGFANTLELVRRHVPEGYKRLDRRKDDRADVVEVWV